MSTLREQLATLIDGPDEMCVGADEYFDCHRLSLKRKALAQEVLRLFDGMDAQQKLEVELRLIEEFDNADAS